jgi:cell wall-associated NlpC family hydrolase
VTARLHDLAEDNERLTEQYNGARIELARSQQRLAAAVLAASAAQRQLARSRQALIGLVVKQYQQPTFSRVVAIMDSSSTGDYLSRMETLSFLSRNRARIVSDHETAKLRATAATAAAKRELAAARANSVAVAAQRKALQSRIADYEKRLAKLTAAQRAALFAAPPPSTPKPAASAADSTFAAPAPSSPRPNTSASSPKPVPAVSGGSGGSAAAQTAVRKALAQLGKPYVFATAGPSTYDCSGLTMVAWAAAGVSIPHQSSAQYRLGSAVSADQLAPGDLVFFYQDLHHVGVYIGNGKMVHAPTTGDVVKVTAISVFGSEYMGARRLG